MTNWQRIQAMERDEYMNEIYTKTVGFNIAARKLIQAAKRDYTLLIGESVTYPRKYVDRPISLEKLEATKMSAEIQGLKINE